MALAASGERFDAIFFDTFAESYTDLRAFMALLPRLLRRLSGVFSFFNGLAPQRLFFHAVYAGKNNHYFVTLLCSSTLCEPDTIRHRFGRLLRYIWDQQVLPHRPARRRCTGDDAGRRGRHRRRSWRG